MKKVKKGRRARPKKTAGKPPFSVKNGSKTVVKTTTTKKEVRISIISTRKISTSKPDRQV
jgi:hypothetical protein